MTTKRNDYQAGESMQPIRDEIDKINAEFAERREHTPGPGVYRGIPMAEYHAWNAASNSRLNLLKRSPAHLKAELDNPSPDTDAFRLGRATHAAILEPDIFERIYMRAPELDRRTKAGKEAWAALQAEHGLDTILKPDEYDLCIAMRDSVRRRVSAVGLLGGKGDCELSAVWVDEKSGVLCKGRADRVSYDLDGGTVVDVKTTTDAGRFAFERSIFNFGYHRQAAFYLRGFNAVNVPVRHFTIIAVEKKPPHEVGIYRLVDSAIEAGAEQINDLLAQYQQCVGSGVWPGYPDEILDIALPTWAWNQIELEAAD
jgi:hypothetical protein